MSSRRDSLPLKSILKSDVHFAESGPRKKRTSFKEDAIQKFDWTVTEDETEIVKLDAEESEEKPLHERIVEKRRSLNSQTQIVDVRAILVKKTEELELETIDLPMLPLKNEVVDAGDSLSENKFNFRSTSSGSVAGDDCSLLYGHDYPHTYHSCRRSPPPELLQVIDFSDDYAEQSDMEECSDVVLPDVSESLCKHEDVCEKHRNNLSERLEMMEIARDDC